MTEKQVAELALEYLREKYPEAIIWRAPAFRQMRWDIFGVFDLILLVDNKAWFIQFTTVTNLSHRRRKIAEFLEKVEWTARLRKFGVAILAWDKTKGRFKEEILCNINENSS